jgi:hypothetical protein
LGHFIGDFLLQFDKIHTLKIKGPKGLLLHIGIVMGCLLVTALPFLNVLEMWLFILFVGVTHYIQDWAKIKFTSHSKHRLFFFCLDQILHIAFIAMLFFTDLRTLHPTNAPGHPLLLGLYNSNAIILYFIAALIASYAGHYIITFFKTDCLNIKHVCSIFEKWYGCVERILIVSMLFPGVPWPLLIPIIFVFRPLLHKALKDKVLLSDQFSSKTEILLSGSMGITTGLILYILL